MQLNVFLHDSENPSNYRMYNFEKPKVKIIWRQTPCSHSPVEVTVYCTPILFHLLYMEHALRFKFSLIKTTDVSSTVIGN